MREKEQEREGTRERKDGRGKGAPLVGKKGISTTAVIE